MSEPRGGLLRHVVATALRQRVVVVAVAAVLLVLGARAASEAPLDVFPEFAPPTVEIQTEAPGLSSEEVEALVSMPLEHALGGLSGLKGLRSKSVMGLSSVVLLFADGTELLAVRQLVQEKVDLVARDLPSVAGSPILLQPLSSLSRVMKVGISSKTQSQMEMTDAAKWTLRPRLLAVPGVANVAIWGERTRELQVLVAPERLALHEVTLAEVMRAAREAVSLDAGGFVDTANQRLPVTLRTSATSVEELAATPIKARGGGVVRLGDVADVVEGHATPIGDAVIDDHPGLLLIVEKQPAANTLSVTRGVEAAIAAIAPSLPELRIDPTIFRPATFIEQSLANLLRSLLIGCALLIAVLFLFLADWRTAVISAVAIPVSLLLAAWIVSAWGGVLDTMAIAGLAIALGEVVDDAIIDVENIVRRLRLNRAAAQPRSAFAVVLEASLEVRSAVLYGSLIVVLVVLPVFALEGLSGAFFRPLARAYVLAMVASLATALVLTPALALLLLPRAAAREREPWLLRALGAGYRRTLVPLLRRPWLACALLVLPLVGAFGLLPPLGQEFLPRFRERDFLMHFVEKPGTSLEAMRRITERASVELRAIPGVRNFGSHIGRAEVADEVVGPNFTELWISVDPQVDYDATVARVQEAVDGYAGLQRDLLTYLRERIKEVLTGASASLVVRISGPDTGELRRVAGEVREALAGIAGVAELKVEPQTNVPRIDVQVDQEAAARFGLAAGDVRHAVATLVRGSKVGELFAGHRTQDVVVWSDPKIRGDLLALRELPLEAPGGALLRLRDVASVELSAVQNVIQRENGSRRIDVTLNVRDRDLGAVAADVAAALKARSGAKSLRRGVRAELLGEWAEREAASRRLGLASLLSLLGIVLLLYIDLRSSRLVLLVAGGLPLSLIGGWIGARLAGGVLSLGSLVGFVTVLGIAVRTTLMLVSHFRHLRREEGVEFGDALVLRGAAERLAPILMTSATTAFALLPIALAPLEPGHEIEAPMAVVILGGLAASMVVSLYVVPLVYRLTGGPTEGARLEEI